jgi:hypothetical protein
METKYIVNNVSSQIITGDLTVDGIISGGTFYGDGSSLTGITSGLAGTNYIYVAASGTDIENATELQAAYITAISMSPSATSRITIIASPGYYNFESTNFTMDAEYIDLVSLDGNRSVIFNSTDPNGTINITANNVFVKGVDVQTKSFLVEYSLDLLKVDNCVGGHYSFGSTDASGIFKDCIGGNFSFGGGDTADGTFINCIGGYGSFGGDDASGVFTNCTGGDYSFGGGDTADGTFINCIGGNFSFGGDDTAGGTFTNCTGGDYSFGGTGEASGIFTNCVGGDYSFGSNYASGTFTNCVGGDYSFGSNTELSGKLFYCRKTSGTFRAVSGSGVTRFCLDGTNTANNQG